MATDITNEAIAWSATNFFVQAFFKDPNDTDKQWKPFKYQQKLYDYIDFGYNPYDGFKPSRPPEMIVFKSPRQFGKTASVASAAAALALRHKNTSVGIVSIKDERAKELLLEVKSFIEHSNFSDWIIKDRVNKLMLKNGSYIDSHPTSPKIRGSKYTWLIVDEAAYVDDEIMEGDAFPTVRMKGAYRRWKKPSIILLSTPEFIDGKFFDYFMIGINNREIGCLNCGYRIKCSSPSLKNAKFEENRMENVPNCPECGHNDFTYIYNDVALICPTPYDNPLIDNEEVDRELRMRGDTPRARAEILGEFMMGGSGLIHLEWLQNCTDPNMFNMVDPKSEKTYVCGMDFGKAHDATVMAFGYKEKENFILDFMYRLPGGDITYNEIRYDVLTYIVKYKPRLLVLDTTGLGEPIVERIKDDMKTLMTSGIDSYYEKNGRRIKFSIPAQRNFYTKIYSNRKKHVGFWFDQRSKIDLIDYMITVFQQSLVRIPHEQRHDTIKVLWNELQRFNYEFTKAKNIKYGTQNTHDDTVIALALMLWGLKTRPTFKVSGHVGGKDNYELQPANISWDVQL